MDKGKLSKAKVALMMHKPYFGMMASHLKISYSDNQESFLSDGDKLYINGEYLKSLTLHETEFILSNASMHRLLDHKGRQSSKMEWLWQLSTDYAINSMLIKNGMQAPSRINYQERFDGMYAEEIYAQLKTEIKNDAFDDNEEHDTGFNENNKRKKQEQKPQEKSKEQSKSSIEADAQQQMIEADHESALDKAFKAGDIPLDIERLLGEKLIAHEPWNEHLLGFIQMNLLGDFRMFPSNKKHLYRGVLLPSFYPTPKKLAIAVDTSGSISQELLTQFITEVESLRVSVEHLTIELFAVDATIHTHHTFHYGEPLEYTFKGGGGTDLSRVFDYIDKEALDIGALLYFTDGEATFPQDEPDYAVMWVLSGDKHVPFGEKVILG